MKDKNISLGVRGRPRNARVNEYEHSLLQRIMEMEQLDSFSATLRMIIREAAKRRGLA